MERAGRWLLDSGIQEASGGVARYYRSDLGGNAKVSTEITGYAVSALLYLHHRTGQPEYLDAGLRAARFLARTAWDPNLGTFPFEHSANGDRPRALAYFFDCGIIVRGLLAAWRVSKDPEFRDTAIARGPFHVGGFLPRGCYPSDPSVARQTSIGVEARWSAGPGCYQLKSAMAWYELFETTGEMEFLRAYESAVELALASENDFLPGASSREQVMDRLHAYLYFLEGLLPVLDRPDCAQAYRAGMDRVAAYLQEIAPLFARSDVYAQLLRARLYGERLAGIPLDRAAAAQRGRAGRRLSARILRYPRWTADFCSGAKTAEALPYVNPVSTAFCVQALAQWDDRKNKCSRLAAKH